MEERGVLMRKEGTEAAWKTAKRRRILEAGFRLFAEKGIDAVTMPEVAEACDVGRATLYRYFPTKLDLVVAISTMQWEDYIGEARKNMPRDGEGRITGAEQLRYFFDSFIDLYINYGDILRFNYAFNMYLRAAKGTEEQTDAYVRMVDGLAAEFHKLYERGREDGTLNTDIPEREMFTSAFHIMLAAVTRYAMGLIYPRNEGRPEDELIMLGNVLYAHFTKKA